MVRIALALMWAGSTHCLAQESLPETVPEHKLCIHLYNLAEVPLDVLHGATKEAARILARAGIETIWQESPAAAIEAHIVDHTSHSEWQHRRPDIRNYLVVSIGLAGPSGPFPGALGYALPDAQAGVHAMIFYDRVQKLTPPGIISLPNALGHGMAHEIGHVLLGSTEHSAAGIMKANWGRTDYQRAQAGSMEFSAAQGRVMQERAPKRLANRAARECAGASKLQ